MKKRILIFSLLFTFSCLGLFAQTPFERLGQKAMIAGDYNSAASYFEKAYAADLGNMNALWLLGYAYYHATEYRKSISTFDKLLALKPTEIVAYYYRGKAKFLLFGVIKDEFSNEKEALLISATKDFSTAIDLSPDDMKLYQNRGLTYQQFGIYKSQKLSSGNNKSLAINLLNSSIADFQKVLSENNNRKDILNQIDRSKQVLMDIR